MAPKKFEQVEWDPWVKEGNVQGFSTPGWAMPSDSSRYISKDDPYWTQTMWDARLAYGDPNIHYNTDESGEQRYLVFGDGIRLPENGQVVYHDSLAKQNYIQNTDGTVTRTDSDGNPQGEPFWPSGYRKNEDGRYAPVSNKGIQVSPLANATPPSNYGYYEDPNTHILTPRNANGDYYTIDPNAKQQHFFNKDGKPIPKEQYYGGTQTPPATVPKDPAPAGSSTPNGGGKVEIPSGMTAPQYPDWATVEDPDVGNRMTEIIVRLYKLFGDGSPSSTTTPAFPFNTETGKDSGIEGYDKLKDKFKQLEGEFTATAKAFDDAIEHSKVSTEQGRKAINDAIGDFNSKVSGLPEGRFDSLLQAEVDLIGQARTAVAKASNTTQDMPAVPTPDPGTPAGPPLGATPGDPLGGPLGGPEKSPLDELLNKLGGPGGGGLPGMGGGLNPLGALGGMNPGGSPGGGGGGLNPLAPISEAAKPLAKLADPGKPDTGQKPAVTPLKPIQDQPPGVPQQQGQPGQPGQPQPGQPQPGEAKGAPGVEPAGNSKATVKLPDGTIVDAPNEKAAAAAQNALERASNGGDAAQKAYDGVLEDGLPGDGKNPGAKVDPADLQAGDVLKWKDKTMVAVGPGLVADPTHPGVVHELKDVLKDDTGFKGIFRPTATDPTLSMHSEPPPLPHPEAPQPPPSGGSHGEGSSPAPAPAPDNNPPPPAPPGGDTPAAPPKPETPPATVPLSGDLPGDAPPASTPPAPAAPAPQPAPPSPFHPPAASRSTKAERIAAGQP